MRHPLLRVLAFLVACLLAVPPTLAQPLADRLPADAMVYVGWKGSTTMGDAYKRSHLQAVIAASDLPKIATDLLPQLMEKVSQKDPNGAEALRIAAAIAGPVWRHESALCFGGLAVADGRPLPKLAVLVRAGDDAPELLRQVNDAIRRAGQTPVPIDATAHGDLVVVTIGRWENLNAIAAGQLQDAGTLKTSPKFTAAMAHVQKDPVAAVYVDAEALIKLADGMAAGGARPAQQQTWQKVKAFVGLEGLRQIAWTGGFEGRNWLTQTFVGAPAPRPGLLAAFGSEPVSDDALKLIPRSAVAAQAARFDLARFAAALRQSAAKADPDAGRQVESAFAQASRQLGMDIEQDLLAPLGDQWAAYISPEVGGNGFLGLALVNKLDESAKAAGALQRAEVKLNELIRANLPPDVTVRFKTQAVDGLELHYLAIPIVTPTWAVADGNLYVALYPQVVSAAAHHIKRNGPSILQNSRFTTIRKRLAQDRPAGAVQFADLQETAPNAYPMWLLFSRYVGFADLFGVDSPLMMFPPIHKLMPELEPAGGVSWSDDAGWHARALRPFPGSDVLASDPVGTLAAGQPAVMLGILLPSLQRARATAIRVKSASNLRQIGQGVFLYANEHRLQFPPTLGDVLLAHESLTPGVFISPNGNTQLPQGIIDRKQLAAWVNENADYVYLGAGRKGDLGHEAILAYEKPEVNGMEGMNVLFGDGHVEWLPYPQAMERIEAQQEKGGNAPPPQ